MSILSMVKTDFPMLRGTDTVGTAIRRILDDRVSDLPVIDDAGRLIGIFKLAGLYTALLPKAALIGLQDLAFVSDTLGQLREKMREIEHVAIHEFVVKPDCVVHPEASPLELVLLLYQGINNIPVVDPASGRLAGMVSARDLLTALHDGGGA